jgi:hypothetical protein
MIAATLAPLDWRSKDRTVSCFEVERLRGCAELDIAAAFGLGPAAVALVERGASGARTVPRGRFAARILDFDFWLLMAIRPFLSSRQHPVLPLGQAPRIGQGECRRGCRAMAP